MDAMDLPEAPGAGSRNDEVTSGWQFYSLGFSAHNKPLGVEMCEVVLLEVSTLLDGEVTDRGVTENIDYLDGNDVKKARKEVTSASVPAKWYCQESNRITPPDVRRNEELIILRFADTGELFWVPRNTNRNTRKLETVAWAYSGTQDESDDSVTDQNHYIAKLSTHDKQFLFSTSDKNGEVCRWYVQIRADDGKFIICDDNGNEVLIDSVNKLIRLINGDDALLELNGKDVNMDLPGNYNVNVKGDATFTVTGNASIKALTYVVTADNITFNGKSVFNGAVEIVGALAAAGAEFSGPVNFPAGHGPH